MANSLIDVDVKTSITLNDQNLAPKFTARGKAFDADTPLVNFTLKYLRSLFSLIWSMSTMFDSEQCGQLLREDM